jgi:hypothetical protein
VGEALAEDTAEPFPAADVKAGDHRLLDHPGLWVRAGAVVVEARVGLAEGVRPAALGKLTDVRSTRRFHMHSARRLSHTAFLHIRQSLATELEVLTK